MWNWIGIVFLSLALNVLALSPPYSSVNRQNVANALNTLHAEGKLKPGLAAVYAKLSSFNSAVLNNALDQLHPVAYSALVEVQAALGGQILSLYHRWPTLSCGCGSDWRLWAEPMGNWLTVGNIGEQTGFEAITKGIALGFDKMLGTHWSVGAGFIWNRTDLTYQQNRGKGTVNRFLGAAYADYSMDCFTCGLSFYSGVDFNDIHRHIGFPMVDMTAVGQFNSLDLAGQFSAAYLFGFPYIFLYPYANFDTFYFHEDSFSESGADGLDLSVGSHGSVTIRTEAGIGLKLQDANFNETICVAPTIALGWAMECPVLRPAYNANFVSESVSFEATGWNHTWQLLSLQFGLAIYIYDFVIAGEYLTESAPSGLSDFWSQRGNLRLEYSW